MKRMSLKCVLSPILFPIYEDRMPAMTNGTQRIKYSDDTSSGATNQPLKLVSTAHMISETATPPSPYNTQPKPKKSLH